MTSKIKSVGIIGGSGMLGSAMGISILNSGIVQQKDFWISNRSGTKDCYSSHADINVTTDNQLLADNCTTVILCVPPSQWDAINVNAPDKLFISVMAGVSLEQIRQKTSSNRVVRAMSSPAAEHKLAYSPWVADEDFSTDDKHRVQQLLQSCGTTDELEDEAHIEIFTAMTGPVPGFVAYFAQTMTDFAIASGVSAPIADRAVRQLFLGAANIMSKEDKKPSEHVQEMIDYDGTTAAGLRTMRSSSISDEVMNALSDSVKKTRSMSR